MALDTLKQFLSKEISASRAEDRLLSNPMYQEQLKSLGMSNEEAFGKLKDNQEQRKLDMFTEDLIKKATESPDFDPNNIDPSSKAILDYAQRNNIDPLQAQEIIKYRQQIPFDLASRQINNPKYSALMKTIYPELSREGQSQSSYDAKKRIEVANAETANAMKLAGYNHSLRLKEIEKMSERDKKKEAFVADRQILVNINKGDIDLAKKLYETQLSLYADLVKNSQMDSDELARFAINSQDIISGLAAGMDDRWWTSDDDRGKFEKEMKSLLSAGKFQEALNVLQGVRKKDKKGNTVPFELPEKPVLNEAGNSILNKEGNVTQNELFNQSDANIPSLTNKPKIKKGSKITTGVTPKNTVFVVASDGKKYDTGITIKELSILSEEERKKTINNSIKELFEIVE